MLAIHGDDQDQPLELCDRSWHKPSSMGNKGDLELRSDLASLSDIPNLNSNSISSLDSQRASYMGRDRVRIEPNMKYSPAKGLVKLFSRTCRQQKNPNATRTQS
jgi:hypothetical protein